MDKKIISILKKVYHYENGFYNPEHDRHEHHIPESVSQQDLSFLATHGFSPNHFETFEHDDVLDRFVNLQKHPKLTLDFAKAMFLKGLTGEFLRGRQTLMSYVYIKHLTKHPFEGDNACEICGIPQTKTIDKTEQLYSYYHGSSWNELPLHFLIELEEIIQYEQPSITQEDLEHLKKLLDFIAEAAPTEAPSKLE